VLHHDVMTDDAIADAAWQRARAAYPALPVTRDAFLAFARARVEGFEELLERNVEDLFLACASANAAPLALAILEERVWPAVERGLGSIALDGDARRDLVQMMREQMLVRGAPGIAGYDGRAPLVVWLRVCAGRLATRHVRRNRRIAEVEDRQLAELAPGVPDPRLAYFKRHYGEQFRAAFGEALVALSARDRNLLRHAVLDGLGIDQIAAIYHVHRATAARQIRSAREQLVAATRERMRTALRVSESELESIMRVFTSIAEVTLRDALARPQKSEAQ